MPPAQHDTGECVPQVVTNIYGGLGLPTRRRFTFPLPYAGREQVAPAGTCRAAPSEVERQPARLFWYWVSFPLSELCSRVGSFRVRTKRSRFSAQNEVSRSPVDRKSTRLNSSHANISYAVFCLKKKKKDNDI